MAQGYQRNNIEIKQLEYDEVTVANSVRAKLMFYLKCVDTVLDLSEIPNISYFINFRAYYLLDDDDMRKLLFLCYMFDPVTIDQVFHKVYIYI
jgi:hypothetical protein